MYSTITTTPKTVGFSVTNNGVGMNREIINGGYTSRTLQGGWENLKQDQRQKYYAVVNGFKQHYLQSK